MERVKLETQIGTDLMRGIKERGRREGKDASEIVEEALRRHLRSELFGLMERVAERSGLTEEEALSLANGELKEYRAGR